MYLPAPDEQVHLGVLRLVLRIPGSRSLKDRRRVVASLRDRVAARHHAWLAEVGHLENQEAAVLAVSILGNDARVVRSRLDLIRGEAEALGDAWVAEQQSTIFPLGEQLQ